MVSPSKCSQGTPVFICPGAFTKVAKNRWYRQMFLVLYLEEQSFYLPISIFPSTA